MWETLYLIVVIFTAAWGHLHRFLTSSKNQESLLLFAFVALLILRSFVDIDGLFAYQIGSFPLYFLAGKLTVRGAVKFRLFVQKGQVIQCL
ncbi:hypothetical protein ASF29_12425 [Rhizobium sp. Leaf262]|nr:hypothetical protein ASF29_12425 [Rhizobium sp. Leaf262]